MKIKAVPGQYFLTLQTGSNSCEEDEKQKAARVTNEKRRDKFEKTNTNVLYFWNKRRTTGKSSKAPSVWEEPSRLGLSPARAGLTWVLLVSGPGTSAPVRASGLLVDRGLMLRGGATSFFSEREASDQMILKLTYGKKRTEIAQMV